MEESTAPENGGATHEARCQGSQLILAKRLEPC
jgi:hypothetical protein